MTAAPTRSLAHHVERYLLRCEVEAKAADTLRAYRTVLDRFVRVLAEDGMPDAIDEITSDHIYAYLGHSTHLRMDTRHRYFREVRCFFNWLVARGDLDDNPFRGMENVKRPQLIKQPFDADDITALLAACGDPASDAGLRDRAMVLTLLDTGIRCTELARACLADLDLKAGRLLVNGKGNKQRRLCQVSGHRWHRGNGFPLSPALRRRELRDQPTPTREEESSLLRQRDVAFAAAVDPEVLPQLIERQAEARR
jgi:site-specific recombinase XerD